MHKKKFLLFFVIWLAPITSFTNQTEVAKIWNTFTINISHKNYRFYLEPQLRVQDAPNKLDQFVANMGIGYLLRSSLTAWVGTTSLIIGSLSANIPDRSEFRSWQQIIWASTVSPYNLQWRARLEERKRAQFTILNYRLRNRLTVSKPLYKSYNWILFDEFFLNLNRPSWITSKTIDQNRFFIGIDQKFSSKLTMGIGYLNQYIVTRQPITGHVAFLFAQWENN